MSRELPIACTLDATDLAARERLMAGLGHDALLHARRDGTHAVLSFAARAGVRERVDAFVAGERTCCAFLTMAVAEAGDAIELTIDAPAGAEPVLAEMVAAFALADRRVA